MQQNYSLMFEKQELLRNKTSYYNYITLGLYILIYIHSLI